MSEPHVPAIPSLEVAQSIFLCKITKKDQQQLLDYIREKECAPLWKSVRGMLTAFPFNEQEYDDIVAKNTEKIATLKKEIDEATEQEGEVEVSVKYRNLAEYYAGIGENQLAVDTFQETVAKTPTVGAKIDLHFAILRVHFFFLETNVAEMSKVIEDTKLLIEQGGDWDRRNRLKAYTGLYLLYVRDWSAAADALLDALSTFTATEIATFEEMVVYGVVAGVASLSRTQLKSQVVDAPEVLGTLPEFAPSLDEMVNCLYTTSYTNFFSALAHVEQDAFKTNRYLIPHTRYFTRCLRQKAYAQLLSSYTTLSLASFASSFAASVPFVEADLERMIADGKLAGVVIDRVNGLVQMNFVDGKMPRYEAVVKAGDEVLRKVQRYAGVVRGMGVAV